MNTTLAIVSDLHVNSTVGLCTPIVNLDDGGTYHSSRSQRWLYDCWIDFCDRVKASPGRKVVVINGDLGENDTKDRSYQLVSNNESTQLSLCLDVLSPLMDIADTVYIIRGTSAHTGKSAWFEEKIGQDFDNVVPSGWADKLDKKTGRKTGEKIKSPASWWHLRAVLEGVRLDIAHHAAMGSLPWTEKHAAMKIAERIMWRYSINMKQDVPHLAIRSHNHRISDSGINYETRATCTPAFELLTEYCFRTGKENDLADYGGLIITCENGQYQYDRPVLYTPAESRKVWRLKM